MEGDEEDGEVVVFAILRGEVLEDLNEGFLVILGLKRGE
jgi:hypothetical protein